MLKSKKIISIALILALTVNVFAFAASAALGDGNKNSASVKLDVGTLAGDVFTPLAMGQALALNDVITVRVTAETDFLCGASSFVIMFDKTFFNIVGSGSSAYTFNTSNTYYSQTCTGIAGSTIAIPQAKWPAGLSADFAIYKALRVNTAVGDTSANGGYPSAIPGTTWLYQINLKALKAVPAGSDVRIWMDKSWMRDSVNTTLEGYFSKCNDGEKSTAALSNIDFNIDMSAADIKIPLSPQSKVTFDTAGGSAIDPVSGSVGAAFTAPENPVKEGYTFTGWSPVLPAVFPPANTTYTALWSINSYSVIFESAGGSAVAPIRQEYGTPVTVSVATSRPGYTFNGWLPVVPATIPAADTFCVAQWTANTYTVVYNGNGATSGTTANSSHIYDKDKTLTNNGYYRTGYTFLGWSSTAGGAVEYTNKQSVANLSEVQGATVTLYAVWSINSYTCTFNTMGGVGDTTASLEYGAPIVVPVVSKEGYEFIGWDKPVPATMPANDLTFYASFSPYTYDAVFYNEGALYATVPTPCGQQVVAPNENPSKIGYDFSGWNPAVNSSTVMLPGGMTFNAVYLQQPLRLAVNGQIIDKKYTVIVPIYKIYAFETLQLQSIMNPETAANAASIVYSLDANDKNMKIDQTGKITNKGIWGRSCIVTVTAYDKDKNVLATDTAEVVFKKMAMENFLDQFYNFIVKILPAIKTIISWFKK